MVPDVMPAYVQGPGRLARQYNVLVDDPDLGMVAVRWFVDRDMRWRCRECGDQPKPECEHTFAAGLALAENLLGLTRVPELDPKSNQLTTTGRN